MKTFRWAGLAAATRLLLSASTMLVGALIYTFWRVDSLLMFVWFDFLGVAEVLQDSRAELLWMVNLFPDWVVYSLPNALWLFSGMLLFDYIWDGNRTKEELSWISLFLLVAFGAEFGQALKVLPGTFDWYDMSLMLIAGTSAFFIMRALSSPERKLEGCLNDG